MSNFYFFADRNQLASQRLEDAYGPAFDEFKSPGPGYSLSNNIYNVTTKHKLKDGESKSNAYAVCRGRVYVVAVPELNQPITIYSKVNLILQPDEQPDHEFPNIKFFIYRGIKLSSLFYIGSNGKFYINEDKLPDNTDNPNANDLSKFIQKSKRDGVSPVRSAVLGFENGLNRAPFDSLDKLFFDNYSLPSGDEPGFQLFTVQAGWKIGEFGNEFGLEIMLDNMGFNPPFWFLNERKPDLPSEFREVKVPFRKVGATDLSENIGRWRTIITTGGFSGNTTIG